MFMDAISPIANRVVRKLEESGQVGKATSEITVGDVFLKETTSKFNTVTETGWYGKSPALDNLVEGETYLMILDGEQYFCKCKITGDTYYFGNAAYGCRYENGVRTPLNGDDTGEPFCVTSLNSSQGGDFISVQTNGSHTLSIWKATQTETITPIDPKYLPGVCLPVVELSSIDMNNWEEDSKQLSAEEAVALDKVLASGAKYLMVHSYSYEIPFVFTLPAIYDDDGAVYAYMGYVYGVGALAIANEEGAWVIAREV